MPTEPAFPRPTREPIAVKKAIARERARAVRILLKHVRKQCSGRCCDNCNCLGVKYALEELRGNNSLTSETKL